MIADKQLATEVNDKMPKMYRLSYLASASEINMEYKPEKKKQK